MFRKTTKNENWHERKIEGYGNESSKIASLNWSLKFLHLVRLVAPVW